VISQEGEGALREASPLAAGDTTPSGEARAYQLTEETLVALGSALGSSQLRPLMWNGSDHTYECDESDASRIE